MGEKFMSDRRDFLKGSLVATAGLMIGSVSPALAGLEELPKGLIYSAGQEGKWFGKAASGSQ